MEAVLIACLEELGKEHDKETVKVALETLFKITKYVLVKVYAQNFRL